MKAKTMFGSTIKELREQKGMSVREAAHAWGLTESAIYMIERGERSKLQPDTLRKLAQGLGLSVDELLDRLNPQEVTAHGHDGRAVAG